MFACVRYEAALHVQGINSDSVDIQAVYPPNGVRVAGEKGKQRCVLHLVDKKPMQEQLFLNCLRMLILRTL